MNTSNLARRLEEYESTIQSLRLTPSPATRPCVREQSPGAGSEEPARPRRTRRRPGIEIRGQGLRSFRVF